MTNKEKNKCIKIPLKVLKIITGVLSVKCRIMKKCHVSAALKILILCTNF